MENDLTGSLYGQYNYFMVNFTIFRISIWQKNWTKNVLENRNWFVTYIVRVCTLSD